MTDIAEMLRPSDWLNPAGGPRYIQLGRRLDEAIKSGVLRENDPLPSEREIASITGLSRVTVRKAVAELVQTASIVQRRGSGSYVAPTVQRVDQSLSRLTGFSEDMASRGMKVESVWLEKGVFSPSSEETFQLGLSSNERVARVSRLRKADGIPFAIERACLSSLVLPDPEIVRTSLYSVLDTTGHRPVRAIQRISAKDLSGQDAELLGVERGVASLNIERVAYLRTGKVVEFTRSVYRGDAYDFVAELTIPESENSR